MAHMRSLWILVASCLLLIPTAAWAGPPSEVPVQAYLTNDQGEPVDQQVEVTISVYKSRSGGSPLHTETFQVSPDGGTFTAYLGMKKSLDLSMFQNNEELFLGLQVGNDREMSPRLRLATAPYAASAAHAKTADEAETLQGKKPSDFASSDYQPGWKDIKNRPSGQCKSDQIMVGLKSDGSPICRSNPSTAWKDIKNRPTGKCQSGEKMLGLQPDGSPICQPDPDKQGVRSITAGTGLNQSGSQATPTLALQKKSVSSKYLKDKAVNSSKIAKDAVTTSEIAPGAVEGGDDPGRLGLGSPNAIQDGTVTSSDLAKNSVKSADIDSNAVGASEIGSNAVSGGKNGGGIKDETITGWDIKDNSINAKFEVKKGSVRSEEIRDGTVQPKDMAWYGCGSYEPSTANNSTLAALSTKEANKLPTCDKVSPGSFCQTDGECGLNNNLNNFGAADVYLRLN